MLVLHREGVGLHVLRCDQLRVGNELLADLQGVVVERLELGHRDSFLSA